MNWGGGGGRKAPMPPHSYAIDLHIHIKYEDQSLCIHTKCFYFFVRHSVFNKIIMFNLLG